MCKQEKDTSEYNKNKAKKDGLQLHCKKCSKSKCKAYYAANKQEYIARSEERKQLLAIYLIKKLEAGCATCTEKDVVVLDFDHLSNKESGIAELVKIGASIKTIDAEITKCQVLCANCHRRKTAREHGWRKYLLTAPSSNG